ncbi:MAG TPA: hypothetical protein ENL22_03145, partial [candidate division Zixibacteria bacterium]|nr:hypothetical protein [candidate division Zixibacteria bacterium]
MLDRITLDEYNGWCCMKKPVVWIIVAVILVLLAVFYFDIFNLTFSKEKAFASIIHYEDARWLSN